MSDISIQKLARELKIAPQDIAIIANNNDIRGINKNSIISFEIADKLRRIISENVSNKNKYDLQKKDERSADKQKKKYVKEEIFDKSLLLSNYKNIDDKTFESLKKVIKQYRQCWGYEIAYCHFIKIPYSRYSVRINQETSVPFNIVEKIILDVIDSRIIDATSTSIANYLELNYLIVDHYFNGFIRNNMITSRYGIYELSENGAIAYKNGYKLHKETDLDFDLLLNNKWDVVDMINRNDFYYTKQSNPEIIDFPTIDTDGIMKYSSSALIKKMKDSDLCDVNSNYSVTDIKYTDLFYKIMCVISIFDFINNKTINILYDLSQEKIIEGHQDVVNSEYSIFKKNEEYKQHIDVLTHVTNEDVYQQYNITDFYTENREEKTAEDTIVQYYDSLKIRELLLDKIEKAESYVIIHCPWIKDGAVNDALISSITTAVNNGVKIFITYGICQSREQEQSSQDAIDKLRAISNTKKRGQVFVNWIGNDHSKETIIDGEVLLTGSFNFLSYNPYDAEKFASKVRNEVTLALYNKDKVKIAQEKYINYIYEVCNERLSENMYFLCLLAYFEEFADKFACRLLLNQLFSDNNKSEWQVETINARVPYFRKSAASELLLYLKKHKMINSLWKTVDRITMFFPDVAAKILR